MLFFFLLKLLQSSRFHKVAKVPLTDSYGLEVNQVCSLCKVGIIFRERKRVFVAKNNGDSTLNLRSVYLFWNGFGQLRLPERLRRSLGEPEQTIDQGE